MSAINRCFVKWTLLGIAVTGWLAIETTSVHAQARAGASSSSSGFGGSGGGAFGGSGFGTSGSSLGGGSSMGGGSSFTGGNSFTGGSSFTGGTTAGGTGFNGGMGAGNAGGGAIGRPGGVAGGSTYQGISNTNPFAAYYANPFAAGLPSATGTAGGLPRTAIFGAPLYGTTSNSSNMMGGAMGGTATISGANQGNYPGSNSVGVRRAPAYSTTIAFDYTPPATSRVQTDVQAVLARSSKIQSKDTIQVAVDGNAIVLRGIAKDDHERRLTEALVRLTPGVRNLRNELAVLETAPPPRRVP